jgi:hypothetical protein
MPSRGVFENSPRAALDDTHVSRYTYTNDIANDSSLRLGFWFKCHAGLIAIDNADTLNAN